MKAAHRGPLISAGILFGTGLGGLFAPIDLVAMKYDVVWDGLFHAFAWTMVCLGLWRLWSAGKRADVPWSTRTFLGSLAMGWGLFHFIEGLLDHPLLGIHHVHSGQGRNLAFLAFGIVAIVVGWMAVRAGRADVTPRGGFAFDQRPSHARARKGLPRLGVPAKPGSPLATRAPCGRRFRAPAGTRRGERPRLRVPA
jgi:uncharacterized membrane protein